MKKFNVEIEGVSPLLVNRFQERQITSKSKKRSAETKDTPVDDKLYLLDDGKPYIPGNYLERCIIDSAKQFKIAGKQKATYSKYMGATTRVEPAALPLKPNKWQPFTISAVNPMTGGRMMVTRPQFDKWGLEFEIICEDDDISADTVEQILANAGKFTGIGDWRPEKKGHYGRFRIVSFKEAEA